MEERKSKFNGDVRVVKTFGMGIYITSQGLTQSGGIVEDMWRSTLRKIKNQKSKIKSCLVLGLGGGTVAKLVRKNWPETKITGVDIDPLMIELGKKYLNLDKYEVNTIVADASNLSNLPNLSNWPKAKFDLVIIDLYQGDQFPKKFENSSFLASVRRGLAEVGGIAVFNRLYYKEKKVDAEEFGKKLKKVFKNVESFRPVSNIMYLCNN